MVWKKAGVVFVGGSVEAERLTNKKFRTTNPLLGVATYDPARANGIGQVIDIKAGTVGYIGHVPGDARDKITITFPKLGPLPTSLRLMMKSPFLAVRIDWATFRAQFEIDM